MSSVHSKCARTCLLLGEVQGGDRMYAQLVVHTHLPPAVRPIGETKMNAQEMFEHTCLLL